MDNSNHDFLVVIGIFAVQCVFSLIFSFWFSYSLAKLKGKIKTIDTDINNLGSIVRLNHSKEERNLNLFMTECTRKFRELGADTKFTHFDQ